MTLKKFASLLVLLFSTHVYSQYVLDTPDGKKVKLNTDGTWTFTSAGVQTVKSNSGLPKDSKSKFIGSQKRYALWFDKSQWFYDTTRRANTFTWDATFFSMDKAITGFCLESRLSMPMDNLEDVIKSQWQSSGQVTMFTSRKDTVNNLEVVIFDMQLVYGGLTYQYRGLINSTNKGSFQIVVGTQKDIFEEDEEKISLLLKGLTRT